MHKILSILLFLFRSTLMRNYEALLESYIYSTQREFRAGLASSSVPSPAIAVNSAAHLR